MLTKTRLEIALALALTLLAMWALAATAHPAGGHHCHPDAAGCHE